MPQGNEKRQLIVEIVTAIALPALVFTGLYFWQNGGADNVAVETNENEIRSAKVREGLAAVVRINPLSDKIFRSAEWATLVDFTPSIPEVPLGRPDPFSLPPGIVAPKPTGGMPQLRG